MRLIQLRIKKFKNLSDFQMNFSPEAFATVLVGRNGTGKSNVLEALIIIFRDLDLADAPAFTYQLKYACRGAVIQVDADPSRDSSAVRITVNDEPVSARDFSRKSGGQYLPNYIFGYYSGPSNRMERHFEKHQKQFSEALREGDDRPLRPLLYARLVHSQFVLLSFFESESQDREFLQKYLRIQDLETVLFVLKRPSWYSSGRRVKGDPRFWGARGVVQEFLSKLHKLSLAPIRSKQKQSRGSAFDRLYLFLKNKQDLSELSRAYGDSQEFFKALESMYISDLVEDVRTRVTINGVDESLTFRELSEGEQQLLMVLGLLRFIKEDEALFLLDEPDTHLNPAWSLEYLRLLKNAVADQETSQIVMATHDPLVVASMLRSEVQLMQRNVDGKVFAEQPVEDPRGMGISALLMSEVYGLRSELDPETLELLDRKRELAIKVELSETEREELKYLNNYLGSLDFTKTVRDPKFKLFVEAMTEIEKQRNLQLPDLTKEQREEQKRLAVEIVRELNTSEEQGA